MIDNYVMEQIYDMIYFKIHSEFRSEDEKIYNAVVQLKTVDLCQVGLEWELGFQLAKAVEVRFI